MKATKVTQVNFSKEELKHLKNRNAKISDAKIHIDYEAILHSKGKFIAVYKKLDADLMPLLYACEGVNFSAYERTAGLKTNTVNINAIPRNAKRSNVCRFAELSSSRPAIHDIFLMYAQELSKWYKKYFKKEYQFQIDEFINGAKPIYSAYLIDGTPFTGGVANKNNTLNYHNDNANTPNGMSCMLIMKNNIAGGELVLPELGISFACQNGFMLLFDGKNYLHGVTPIVMAKGGYRYTVVYYNNKGMSLCLPPEQELEHYDEYNINQTIKKENGGKNN